jgi:Tfp pilus assembly protein PilN
VITINLLPGKKRPAAGGARFKLRFPDLRGLIANVTNPWLLAASGSWVLVLAGSLALFVTTRTRLAVLNGKLESVRAEQRRFDVVISQMRQSQRIRDSLVGEINVIRKIDADRYTWPHILDQIAKALPPYTWLTGIVGSAAAPPPTPAPVPAGAANAAVAAVPQAPPPVTLQISGSTVDIQAYTTFLRQLAASPWLTEVLPTSTQTVVEQDRPVTAFAISARFKVADSAYIHTVPVAGALR